MVTLSMERVTLSMEMVSFSLDMVTFSMEMCALRRGLDAAEKKRALSRPACEIKGMLYLLPLNRMQTSLGFL